jgi:hypothetical protein
MTQQYTPNDRDARPALSQTLVDWMDRHFDVARRDHSGPEALAWDEHGLQAAENQPAHPNPV